MSIVQWKNLKKAFHAYGKEPNFNVWQLKDGRHRICNGYFVINTKDQPTGAGLTFLINNFNEMPEPNSLMKRHGKDHIEKLKESDGEVFNGSERVIDNVSSKNDIPQTKLEKTGITLEKIKNSGDFMDVVVFYNPTDKNYVFIRKEFVEMVSPDITAYGSSQIKPVYFVEDAPEDHRDFIMIMPIRQTQEIKFLADPKYL